MTMYLKIVLLVLINSALLAVSSDLPNEVIQKYIGKINAHTKCGISSGHSTIPWIANIKIEDTQGYDFYHSDCTGVLLNERYVLSTASCFLENPNVTSPLVFFKPITSKDEFNVVQFNTEKLVIHPDYDSSTGANNVALLKFNQTISPHSYVRPICISPTSHIENAIMYFKTSWVVMYSSYAAETVDPSWPNMMSFVNNNTGIEVFQRKECNELVRAANQSRTFYEHDICVGESLLDEAFDYQETVVLSQGTPLVYERNNVFYLQGIYVDYIENLPEFLSVYHNVHAYLKWLAENIEPYPESCSRWDLLAGECIPLESCHELKNKLKSDLPEFERFRCGSKQNENYVCCDPTIKAGEIPKEKMSTLKNYEICGELPDPSYDYNKDPFPWSAKIYKYDSNDKIENYLCGGIIIGSRYVLTTASCINAVNHRKEEIRVRVGYSILKQAPHCWKSPDTNWNCSLFQNLTTDTVIPHPMYSNGNSMYDMTILYLVEKITFTNYIRPICLPTQDLLKPDDELFTVLWTKTGVNHITTTSKYITNQVCKETLAKGNVNWDDTQNQMCSSNNGTKSDFKCEDILSAAVLSKIDKKWYLQGNSFESSCKENLPIRHNRIVNFGSWIETWVTTELCRIYNNLEGECVPLSFCPSLYTTLSNPTTLPDNVLCKEKGTICCPIPAPPTETNDTVTTSYEPSVGTAPEVLRNLLKIDEYCGIQQSDNYFHDKPDIKIDEFPWLAYLRIYDSKRNKTTVGCGGGLINSRYVITSAKCVDGIVDNPNKSITVRLGEFNIENATDCVYLPQFDTEDCSKFVDYAVEKISVHPSYRELENDIALVRLQKTVIFTDYIRPICLPTQKSIKASSKPGKAFYITGFGVPTLKVRKPKIKKKLSCKILTEEQCVDHYSTLNTVYEIKSNHICTTESVEASEFTCNDDLGDPLMYSYRHQWFLAGVLSYGKQCLNSLPVVHTKLSAYTDWILDNLEPWR